MTLNILNNNYEGICFLDRDGTINVNTGYAHRREELALLPNSAAGIRLLNENRVAVVVVTNQSGVGRGYFQLDDLMTFNACIDEELRKEEAHIDLWRFCSHHPDDNCSCRKPKIGMISDIIDAHQHPMYFVGDTHSDMLCAEQAEAIPMALRGTDAERFPQAMIVADILDAAKFIVTQIPNKKGQRYD